MLQLKNIVKTYTTGDLTQNALQGVSINFRQSEFVFILGPSGSGKTTLLNIIGGLDRYSSGEMAINGVSTREYRDSDWDFYRNDAIGFVFQSYNLIPHQSVLANVELALTLAGISKRERRQRAVAVLEKVGLKEHIHKRPNQLSGGQMQRVAIARALINDPDILLADEPTGALDSETSVQIMELLKEIARDKLVIMVTHNPELAERYSTRIVKLLDGQITDDSNPCHDTELIQKTHHHRKISMSFFTALSLSFNNLLTKKGRTFLTAFAGSIGIIGIALILSLSTGIQNYVDGIQRDTLSSYPISILESETGFASLLSASQEIQENAEADRANRQPETIYANAQMYDLFNAAFTGETAINDLKSFKSYLEREMETGSATGLGELVTTIQYQYGVKLNTYVLDETGKYRNTDIGLAMAGGSLAGEANPMAAMAETMGSRMGVMGLWSEMLPNADGEGISELLYDQYRLLAGYWPSAADEVVLVVDSNGEISDVAFYALGLMPEEELNQMLQAVAAGEEIQPERRTVSYADVLNTTFKLVLSPDYYTRNADGSWHSIKEDEASLELVIENGFELKIVGIVQPDPEAASTAITGTFGYTAALTEYIIRETDDSEIVKQQRLPENENYDVLTGRPFVITEALDPTDQEKAEKITAYFATINDAKKTEIYTDILATPSPEYLTQSVDSAMAQYPTRESMVELVATTYGFERSVAEGYLRDYTDQELTDMLRQTMETLVREKYAEQAEAQVLQIKAAASTPEDIFGAQGYAAVAASFDQMLAQTTDVAVLAGYYDAYMPATVSGSTLAETLETLGAVDYDTPSAINIYAKTFEDKAAIDEMISDYNETVGEEQQISYTDYVAILMSGVTTMIDAVSYGLIAFVSISLVVSSIMIGIITYISVLERTKEIGILRSVGASKKDISRVFNAETILVGLTAGLLGVGLTALANLPISALLRELTGISGIATLPWQAAAILVAISVALTLIAGFIPAKLAAKKDPVVALRME